MKVIKFIVVASAFITTAAYAADPELADITCEQLGEQYELTAEAEERFADLRGTCEGVYIVNGSLYTKTKAVIRRILGRTVRVYLPATDHTFDVTPDSSSRVLIDGRKVRPRNLERGSEISIYLSVDKFAEKRVDEIAFATEDDAAETIVAAPIEEVVTLPTTASPLPLFALLSALLLGAGLLMRRVRHKI